MTDMTTNEVCEEYAGSGAKIILKLLEQDQGFILIEGDANALEFLGKLILAHAKDQGCGLQLGPHAAGNIFFNPGSKGMYVHRLPCEHTNPSTLSVTPTVQNDTEN
jgi:hypothetical protein